MVTLFHDMMYKEIEVYVNDMIVKSRKGEIDLENLKKLFEMLRKYQLKLNPLKCTFYWVLWNRLEGVNSTF